MEDALYDRMSDELHHFIVDGDIETLEDAMEKLEDGEYLTWVCMSNERAELLQNECIDLLREQ